MKDTSGPTSRTQFAEYDPESSSWRTYPATGLWGSTPYKRTWPRSGMTHAGRAYELPTWAPPTGGNGYSSLLKTPTAQLAVNGGSQHPDKRREGGHGPTLADQIECELLPTPSASDGGEGSHLNRGGRRKHEMLLPGVARALLPTPTAMDAKASGGSTPSDVTFTDAVVRTQLGANTNPRFDGGNGSSDATPPHQPNPDLEAGDGSPPDLWSG